MIRTSTELSSMNDSSNSFLLLLCRHRYFGMVAIPWMATSGTENKHELNIRLDLAIMTKDIADADTAYHEITLLSKTISDNEIHRQFSKRGIPLHDFIRSLTEDLLKTHIRPFIDRQMDKMLHLAGMHDIPVFTEEGSRLVYKANRLRIETTPAEPWFCFKKTKDGSEYILELYQEEQKIRIDEPGNMVICNSPCWFLSGKGLYHFPDGFEGKKILPFQRKHSLKIPASLEKKFFESFVTKTLKKWQFKTEGFSVRTIMPARHMELSAEPDWQGNAGLVISFCYDDWHVMPSKSQKVFIQFDMDGENVSFFRTVRDIPWETSMIDQCLELGLNRVNDNILGLPGAVRRGNTGIYALVEWVNSYWGKLSHKGIIVKTDRLPENYFTGTLSAMVIVKPGLDWFDVQAMAHFSGYEVPFTELGPWLIRKIREFPLPGGEIAILPREWFARYGDLCYFSETHDKVLRLPSRYAHLIRSLGSVLENETAQQLSLLDPSNAPPIEVPYTFQGSLRPYQEEGLQWLNFLNGQHFGGCLADDMGLGKTVQTLAFLLSLQNEPHPASLIVMPASLIHNWRNEIMRFAPSLRVLIHTGNQRSASVLFFNSVDVILTTYGILRNDMELLDNYRFHYVILDESQVIKNPNALISLAVCQLRSEFRLVLTGTPIENSLTDLWSQMEFLNPGLLGPLNAFQKRFGSFRTEISYTENDETMLKPQNNITLLQENEVREKQDENSGSRDRLRGLIAPFILRRTKEEAEPDLPLLTIGEWFCSMPDDQQERYEEEKSAVRNEVLEKMESGIAVETSVTILKALIRLRQIASHPALVDPSYPGGSGKFDEIIRCTATLKEEGHKILIFSSFVKHLKLVESYFLKNGMEYSILTGSTREREAPIRKFREDQDCNFFLISLKAGGTGLNLTGAGYVMLLDPWWNPAVEIQAISRAHRIGQEKKVIAYRFITSGTIEEKMLVLQKQKQKLFSDFIPSGNPLKDMTKEEIREFFR